MAAVDSNYIPFTVPHVGCMDDMACNYNPNAIISSECEYPEEGFNCDGTELSLFIGLIPENYSISNIYPNPFNPITNISFGIPENANVKIIIYDLTGRKVQSLINEFQTPGYHSVDWDASSYPSGIYLIRMNSGDFGQIQKVVLIKWFAGKPYN